MGEFTDKVAAAGNKIAGNVKEAVGKATDNERLEAEGEAQQEAWCTIQRGHAIANGVFVAAINRVGHEGPDAAGLDFWGQSFVCDPSGRLLVVGPVDRDEVLLARCNRGSIEQQRRGWPFLRDRRIDTYKGLTARWLDTPLSFTSESNDTE